MLVQTAVTLATIILGFNIPCRGPFGWLAVITILQVQTTHYTWNMEQSTQYAVDGTLNKVHSTQ